MSPFGFFDSVFPVMFSFTYILIIGIIIFTIVRGLTTYRKNNNSPVLTVDATIVAKRQNISRHHNHNNNMHSHTHTTYYVTFEVESGDRFELAVPTNEFGLLVEQDKGKLTFQGTRYKGFERKY